MNDKIKAFFEEKLILTDRFRSFKIRYVDDHLIW